MTGATMTKKNSAQLMNMLSVPWAIRPETMAGMLEKLVAKDMIDEMLGLTDEDVMPDVEVDDGVAVLPINGVIGNKLPKYAQAYFGMVSIDVVSDAFDELDADGNVSAIVIDIDSPGGVVSGVPEFAEIIANASKPVIAYTSGMMCSAAYWIGAGAQAIYASKSANVGSIGVYLPIVMLKKYYERMGIEVDLIKAGRFKGAGYPGTELTEEQRDDLQSGVDYLYRLFSGFVGGRRNLDSETMQGQDFFAEQAIELNLIDSIATIDKAIEDARSLS